MNTRIDLMALWRKLPAADMALVRRIAHAKTWELRSSRPRIDTDDSRYAAYIWRMVAFQVSRNSIHHCMPTTCFWWLPKGTDKATMQRLNRIVDAVLDTVPQDEWWGVKAWSGLSSHTAATDRKDMLRGVKSDAPAYLNLIGDK